MSVITQLPLPYEVQEMVRNLVYYSKTEHLQRKKQKRLMKQFELCERIEWYKPSIFYDYFYYKTSNIMYHSFNKNHHYIIQEICIMSAIFCKKCHEYVSSYSHVPENIICDCLPDLIEGPVAVD